MEDTRLFLQVAEGIGERICREARWTRGQVCTWEVPDLERPHEATAEADPSFYLGTAGIAYFLRQLHRYTSTDVYLETARGALHHALAAEKDQEKAGGGYYSGTAGLVVTLVEMAASDDSHPWLDEAQALGEKLGRGLGNPGGFDLIGGEAGSLLGLLCLHQATGEASSLAAARKLGDGLLRAARREADGLSWDTMHPEVFRNLLGMSHGAGGIGLAFLELYRWTGETRYLFAAFDALRYEDSFPGAAEGRWPDLRHQNLSDYLGQGRHEELVRDLRSGTFVAGEPAARMTAWCHGAPGIALVRARFLAVTGDDGFAAGIRLAAERTVEDLEARPRLNHSLCHGQCGNADVLLAVGRQLCVGRWVEAALAVARRGIDEVHRTGGRWRSGYREAPPAPGLLLGEAGIGLFYLRCAVDGAPGCLLPVPPGPPPREVSYDAELLERGRRAGYLAHVPRTAKAFAMAGVDLSRLDVRRSEELVPGLEACLARRHDAIGEMLHEVLALEAEALAMLCARQDFSLPYLASLVRPDVEVLEDPQRRVGLARGSCLFFADHDWEPLSEADGTLDDVVRRPTTYLLYEAGHRTYVRRSDPLAAALCSLLVEPISVAALVAGMVDHLEAAGWLDATDDEDVAAVRERIGQVLRRAYDDGMVDVMPEAALALEIPDEEIVYPESDGEPTLGTDS